MSSAMRRFDPVKLGGYEADAWVAYYQRRWGTFLRAALGLVRAGFGLSALATLKGAWLVMRANQAWAPYPDNDPDRARALMRRFYALVCRGGVDFDLDEAARLEIEWWRVHRYLQRESPEGSIEPLIDALAALYAHVYALPLDQVREAAAHRAEAMRISDEWIRDGQDPASPAVAKERQELIRGYAKLRSAVS
jgi:hypothetical protein